MDHIISSSNSNSNSTRNSIESNNFDQIKRNSARNSSSSNNSNSFYNFDVRYNTIDGSDQSNSGGRTDIKTLLAFFEEAKNNSGYLENNSSYTTTTTTTTSNTSPLLLSTSPSSSSLSGSKKTPPTPPPKSYLSSSKMDSMSEIEDANDLNQKQQLRVNNNPQQQRPRSLNNNNNMIKNSKSNEDLKQQQQQQQQHQQQQHHHHQQQQSNKNNESDLRRELNFERYSHQQMKHLVKSLEEENRNLNIQINLWKAQCHRLATKLKKVNIIYSHFQSVMTESDVEEFESQKKLLSQQQQQQKQKQDSKQHQSSPDLVSVVAGTSVPSPVPALSSSNRKPTNNSFIPFPMGPTDLHRLRSSTFTPGDRRKISLPNVLHGSGEFIDIAENPNAKHLQPNLSEAEYMEMIENRKHHAFQVLKTEREYCAHLSLLVLEFLQPLRSESVDSAHPFITSAQIKQIFGDVEVIFGSSKLLIEDLDKILSETSNLGLGEVFLKTCDYFKLYTSYVKNYYTSISVLNKLKEESHKFQTFVEEKESLLVHGYQYTDLPGLLAFPLSRIGQYTHMLTELYTSTPFSHPDHKPFKDAVTKMKQIADYVKEKTREYESQNKVRLIQNQITGKFQNLNQPHRRYIKDGSLSEVSKSSMSPLYCFLFNDIIILTSSGEKKKNQNQPSYTFKKEIKLLDAEVSIVNDISDDNKPLFLLTYMVEETSQSSGNVLNGIMNSSLISSISSSSSGVSTGNATNNSGSGNSGFNNTTVGNNGSLGSGTDSIKLNDGSLALIMGSVNGGGTAMSGVDSLQNVKTVKESITFCCDSVRDRDDWVSKIQQYIQSEEKKAANRKTDEQYDSKGGEIDFANSDIQLCEQIGSGGSGCTVHRCTVDGFTCAVKVLKVSKNTQQFYVDQFISEITIMEQLQHQNIAKYLGHRVTTNPERLWLFMEYYPYSLKDIIAKRTTPFPSSEVVWLALEIAKGLEFLHTQKQPIIHRDIKPGNIMCSLDDKNRVCNIRVCDFDTSKILSSGVTLKTCIGTPCYMSPEVLDATSEYSEGYTLKADVWSYAMLIFEVITLLPPYHQFGQLQTVEMILKGTPPPLSSSISANLLPLIEILKTCIELNPKNRPSMSGLVQRLTKLLKSIGKLTEN